VGAGVRGGAWNNSFIYARLSDRYNAAFTVTNRFGGGGGRGVRSAP
jgi:hypothetical protein